jgi:PAS domain S-box-containing protein
MNPSQARDARLADTYEHVGAGVVEVDGDGRITRVNQQLCQLTGYSATELVGRTIFDETVPEDAERDRAQFKRQVSGELGRYTIEKRIYKRGGGHLWAEVSSSSVHDAAGNFLYSVRVQHNISDRKQAEQELAQRMDEQAALFQFSECLQHVASVEEAMRSRSKRSSARWTASAHPSCCLTRQMSCVLRHGAVCPTRTAKPSRVIRPGARTRRPRGPCF